MQDLEFYLKSAWHIQELQTLYMKMYHTEPSLYDMLVLWEEYIQYFDASHDDPRRRYAFHQWLRHIHGVRIHRF